MSTPDYDKMSIEELEKLLNERQRKFARELLADGIAYKAAERAGYSAKTAASQASELLKNPKIAALKRAYAREQLDALGYDKPQLLLKLGEILDRCMAKKPVMEWDSAKHAWVESGVWQFDSRGAVQAIKEIAEMAGLKAAQVVDIRGESVEQFLGKLGAGGRFE